MSVRKRKDGSGIGDDDEGAEHAATHFSDHHGPARPSVSGGDDNDVVVLNGLTTIGERCIHLICEFIRCQIIDVAVSNPHEWKKFQFVGRQVWLRALSHLSQTCARLYVAVRNLPLLPSKTFILPLRIQHGEASPDFASMAYWSKIAGIYWSVSAGGLVAFGKQLQDALRAEEKPLRRSVAGGIRLHLLPPSRHRLNRQYIRANKAIPTSTIPRYVHGFSLVSTRVNVSSSRGNALRSLKELYHTKSLASSLLPRTKGAAKAVMLDLKHIEVLALENIAIQVRALPSRHYIYFRSMRIGYNSITSLDLECVRGFTDLPEMPLLRRIRLFNCPIATYTQRHSTLERVCISNCPSLTAVSLSSAQDVIITSCRKLTAVAIGGGCAQVVELDICPAVRAVTLPDTVWKLVVRSCDTLRHVAGLVHAHTVTLQQLRSFSSLGSLFRVTNLFLSCCLALRSIEFVQKLYSLRAGKCPALSGLPCLQQAHILDVAECHALTDLSTLKSVASLSIEKCSRLAALPRLSGPCQRLHIGSCQSFTEFPTLSSIRFLTLHDCARLTRLSSTLSSLGRCRFVDCPLLQLPLGLHGDTVSIWSGCPSISCDHPFFHLVSSIQLRNHAQTTETLSLPSCRSVSCEDCPNLCIVRTAEECEQVCLQSCPKLNRIISASSVSGDVVVQHCRKLVLFEDLALIGGDVRACGLKFKAVDGVSFPRLKEVQSFSATNCRQVHAPLLESVHETLQVNDSRQHTAFPLLKRAKSVEITKCSTLSSFPELADAKGISVRESYNFQGLPKLATAENICLSQCPHVTDLAALSSLTTLSLDSCTRLSEIPSLKSIHSLKVLKCAQLTVIASLTSAHEITLRECPVLEGLPMLETVQKLRITSCEMLTNLCSLESAASIVLGDCPALKSLPRLARVSSSYVASDCDSLQQPGQLRACEVGPVDTPTKSGMD